MSLVRTISRDQMLAVRKALGFTQGRMADEMGLSKSAYVAVETGTARFRRIHALAAMMIAHHNGLSITPLGSP